MSWPKIVSARRSTPKKHVLSCMISKGIVPTYLLYIYMFNYIYTSVWSTHRCIYSYTRDYVITCVYIYTSILYFIVEIWKLLEWTQFCEHALITKQQNANYKHILYKLYIYTHRYI
jgi:hypothetical protein